MRELTLRIKQSKKNKCAFVRCHEKKKDARKEILVSQNHKSPLPSLVINHQPLLHSSSSLSTNSSRLPVYLGSTVAICRLRSISSLLLSLLLLLEILGLVDAALDLEHRQVKRGER